MNLEKMKSQFTGAYREAFDGAYKYILTNGFPAEYSDEKMAELYDLLLTAQEEGKPAEKIVGADIEAFCKEYFSDFTPENRFVGALGSLFAVACVVLVFSLIDWRAGEPVEPFRQFRLDASPIVFGLLCGALVSVGFRALQPVMLKTKKISAGAWAVIYCVVLVLAIAVCTWLSHGRHISLPGAPFLIGAAVYIVGFLAAKAVVQYRKTGRIFKKKAENPYKDSYYKTLEDKDIRRIIEKQWLKRYRKLEQRGKTTPETFRGEIDKLEKQNRIGQWVTDGIAAVVVVAATVHTATESTVIDTIIFFCLVCLVEYFILRIFHKADKENAVTRRHILADCEASGMNLPAFLAQELGEQSAAR